MAEYNKTNLTAKINSDLADNTTGGITAKKIRDNMVNIVDSVIPIMASGTDVYFVNHIDIRDSGKTADRPIGAIYGQWRGNTAASIEYKTSDDTTNYDNAHIDFYTAPSGASSATGGPGLRRRMRIADTGKVTIYGSGVVNPTLHLKSIHGSGINLLLDGSPKDIAVPDDTNFQIGHWASGTATFTERLTIDRLGRVGLGVIPEQPLHVRASGEAIRFDSNQHSNADLLLCKYKTGTTAFSKNDMNIGFGLGVTSAASGAGYFFIGSDSDRTLTVSPTEAHLVVDSGGYVGLGNRYPKERLVVGNDLGRLTASGDGHAIAIGATNGDAHLYMGSGIGLDYTSSYSETRWKSDNQQLAFRTKSNHKKYNNQLVLDATNGYVGVGNSGVKMANWRPSHHLHVASSGAAIGFAVENSMDKEVGIHIGRRTLGSGILVYPALTEELGHWSSIGYKTGTEVLRINNSGSFVPSHITIDRLGHVGINTDAPYNNTSIGTNRLHVYGSNSAVLIGDVFGGGNSALRLLGSRSTNDTAYIQAGTSAADTGAKLAISRFDTDGTNLSQFDIYSDLTKMHGNFALNDNWISNDGGSEGIKVGDTGNVAVGKVPGGTHVFELNSGQGAQATSTLWVNTSDQRVKENIVTIDTSSALDKIMLLRPVSFNYIDDFCHCINSDPDRTHHNFLAQEVETIFPDSVIDTDSEIEDHETGEVVVSNLKGLDAHAINIHLVAAVQELKTQLDAALVRISQLESS